MALNRKTTMILCTAGGLVAAALGMGARAKELGFAAPTTDRHPQDPASTCGGAGGGDVTARMVRELPVGTLTGALSGSKILARGDGEVYLAVDLGAKDRAAEVRQPVNLAIVLDRSGSMREQDKLVEAKAAAKGIIDRLGPQDRVAFVIFDDDAQVVVPSMAMDAEGKSRLTTAIDGIADRGGGTNIKEGIDLGEAQVTHAIESGHVNRVILLSDGMATVGEKRPAVLAEDAAHAADQGIRITTIGLGIDYNEDVMEALADRGRGQYYYVRDGSMLQAVFEGELKAMQATVATNVSLRLDPACSGVAIEDVYGYDVRREGAGLVVPLADLYGGDHRKLIVRLKAPANMAGAESVVHAQLTWTDATVSGAKPTTSDVELGVIVTADPNAVRDGADRDVLAQVEQVEAAKTMRAATDEYSRGDTDGARKMIEEQEARTRRRAGQYQLEDKDVAPIYQHLDSAGAGMAAAPSAASDEGRDLQKKTKAEAHALSH